MKICIDPGHGGYDPGAIGQAGTKEKDIALAIALQVGNILRAVGIQVVYTRDSDKVIWPANESQDLATRVEIANKSAADLFVSIHCNSGSASASGMEVFTTPGKGPSDKVAEAIVQAWARHFPGEPIRKDLSDGDSDKEANFYVLRNTTMPAVLVETAFLSNPREEQKLSMLIYQNMMATAIADGIMASMGVPQGIPMGHIAVIQGGTTYVPLRGFLTATGLGKIVSWDQAKQEVVFEVGDKQYSLMVGSDLIVVN